MMFRRGRLIGVRLGQTHIALVMRTGSVHTRRTSTAGATGTRSGDGCVGSDSAVQLSLQETREQNMSYNLVITENNHMGEWLTCACPRSDNAVAFATEIIGISAPT